MQHILNNILSNSSKIMSTNNKITTTIDITEISNEITKAVVLECINVITTHNFPNWAGPGDEREAFVEMIQNHFNKV